MLAKENSFQSKRSTLLFAGLAALLGIIAGVFVIYMNNPVYILVGLACLIGFVAAVGSIEFGLLLLVFITYTRFSDIAVHNYGAPSIAKSFIVLLIIAIVIRWGLFNERPRGLLIPMIVVAAYGLVGFTSLLYAPYKAAVQSSLSNNVKDALIALLVVALLKKPYQFRQVIWTLLLIGIFIGSLSVHQYMTRNFSSSYGGFAVAEYMNIVKGTDDYRLSGPVGDPNFFAQVMVVLTILGVERLLHEKKLILKIFAGLSAIVSLLTVAYTFSRGATVALALSFVILFGIYRLKPMQVVIMLMLGIAFLLYTPKSYFERTLTLQDLIPSSNGQINVTQDSAIQGRASENLTAWIMWMEHPLTGIGLNNFPYLYPEYTKSLGLAQSMGRRSPHNLYLEVAAETGIIGLTAFLLMVGLALRSILYARRKFREAGMEDYANMATGFAIAFCGYLLAAVFIHASYPRYFYLLIGIAYSLPFIFEQVHINEEKVAMQN